MEAESGADVAAGAAGWEAEAGLVAGLGVNSSAGRWEGDVDINKMKKRTKMEGVDGCMMITWL